MGASPFVEDPGPGFDQEAAAAGADDVRAQHEAEARAAGVEAFTLPEVEEEKVRTVLFNVGDGVHAIAGVGDYDWVMTQRDLDRIAPPLTRILNRYDAAKVAAGYSDELAVLIGAGLYGWRSMLERVAVTRAEERNQASEGPSRAPRPEPPAPASSRPAPAAEPPSSPAPAPPPTSAGVGGDHYPGAGAPQEPRPPAQYEVAAGYVTHAERLRQQRERSPIAVPAEAPNAT